MQNRGAIRLIAVALTLVCIYQLSFTWVSKRVESKAESYADTRVKNIEDEREQINQRIKFVSSYLDSISSETVYNFLWLRKYSYKEVKEREINLGLDLRGGM
ncbi:MAG: hypothetical protein PHS05_11200, partial [Bacteroidales bacterium]|nr:hypothetical protein [Bacteroidales bacterium]